MSGFIRDYFQNSYKEMVSFFAREKKISADDLKEIMCGFQSFCYLDKVKPSKNNCIFKVTDEFQNYLLTAIESSDSPLKEKLIEYAKLFYAPHTTTPYEVAHPNNFSFKHPEETELSQQLYNFVCEAAEATGCRVK